VFSPVGFKIEDRLRDSSELIKWLPIGFTAFKSGLYARQPFLYKTTFYEYAG
jgi:hypothetical protein